MPPDNAAQLETPSEALEAAIDFEQKNVLALITPLVANGILVFSEVSDKTLEVAAEHPLAVQALKAVSFISSKASEGEPNAFVVGAIGGAAIGMTVALMIARDEIKQEENILKKIGYVAFGAATGAAVGAGAVGVNIALGETVFSRE